MWPFKRTVRSQDIRVGEKGIALLREHGLPSDGVSYVTIVLGVGRQTREDPKMLVPHKGYLTPTGVVQCTQCRERSRLAKVLQPDEWDEGESVREKHWHIDESDPSRTMGLTLKCFYDGYMNIIEHARLAYGEGVSPEKSPYVKDGRIALVRVSLPDILAVEKNAVSAPSLGPQPATRGELAMKVSKLKVLDLMDELPLVPSESFVAAIVDAPAKWHRQWHPLVDAIQLRKWRDFPTWMAASLRLSGL